MERSSLEVNCKNRFLVFGLSQKHLSISLGPCIELAVLLTIFIAITDGDWFSYLSSQSPLQKSVRRAT